MGGGAFRRALALGAFALRYAKALGASPARWADRLEREPRGGHLYYAGTLQQQRALERIAALDPQAVVLDARRLPRRIVLRLALAALPLAWRSYRGSEVRLALLAAAYAAAWREVLARLRPQCVVVASDTALGARAAVHAARQAGVPSVYLQHGCVTGAAPALTADYALLDGAQALEVYGARGLGGAQVSLVGVARLGGARIGAGAGGAIAVCGGHLSPLPVLVGTLRALQRRFPERRVVLRPHPRQLRDWRVRLRLRGLPLSDARSVPAAEFLGGVAAVVAGSSSILMEAAALGAASVYYRALDVRASVAQRNETALDTGRIDYDDYYGFLAAGLCPVAAGEAALFDAVAAALRGAPERRERARPWCDTIGGPWDGRSHELALRCIRAAARREPLPLRWT